MDGIKLTLDYDFNKIPLGFFSKLLVNIHLPAFDEGIGDSHRFVLMQHSCCTLSLAEFMRLCKTCAVKLVFAILGKELIRFADVFFFNELAGKSGFTTTRNAADEIESHGWKLAINRT